MKKHTRLLGFLLALTLLLSAMPLLTLNAEAAEYDLAFVSRDTIFRIGDVLKTSAKPYDWYEFANGGPKIQQWRGYSYTIGDALPWLSYDSDYFEKYTEFTTTGDTEGGGSGGYFVLEPYTPHPHIWEITENGNTLTVRCTATGLCDAGGPYEITVNAHSVTLPDSPFNATVSIPDGFKEATGLSVDGPFYNYKAPGESTYQRNITPGEAKAGSYQAVISITTESKVEIQSEIVPGGSVTYSAYVDYQAIDPHQTAATGDDRPIELALSALAVFTTLAAAAFLLDRRFKPTR